MLCLPSLYHGFAQWHQSFSSRAPQLHSWLLLFLVSRHREPLPITGVTSSWLWQITEPVPHKPGKMLALTAVFGDRCNGFVLRQIFHNELACNAY